MKKQLPYLRILITKDQKELKTNSDLSLRGRVLTKAGISGVPEAALALRLHNKLSKTLTGCSSASCGQTEDVTLEKQFL